MNDNLFCRVEDGAVGAPVPLPFEAHASDGRSFTALAEQLDLGNLTLADLADMGLYPATVTDTGFDPATEAGLDLVCTFDPETHTVACVRGKRALTDDELAAREATRIAGLITAASAERERRIFGGFTFQGVRYQTRPEDYTNLSGGSTGALGAIMGGAPAGNFRWADPDKDFAWIAEDNSETPMDAQTMFALGSAALVFRSGLISAARALKNRILAGEPIADVTAAEHWPA